MKKFKNIIVSPLCKISKAVEMLQTTDEKIILILEKKKILGTLTDGDIRRAIINNIDFKLPVTKIMNNKPLMMKFRQDESFFLEFMKKNVIRHLPIVNENNELVDLKLLDQFLVKKKYDNWVLLMCGGRGERLSPLTDSIPKPMISIGDKPILEIIIENLIKEGFQNFMISVNYLKDQIKNYFGDGSSKSIRIEYIDEKKKLGTAGSMSLIKKNKLRGSILVMNGDVLTKLSVVKILKSHTNKNDFGTVVCKKIINKLPYGEVLVKNKKVKKINEKPKSTHLISAGIYVFDKKVLDFIKSNEYLDMPDLINDLIKKKKSISFYINDKEWVDIGNNNNLSEARSRF